MYPAPVDIQPSVNYAQVSASTAHAKSASGEALQSHQFMPKYGETLRGVSGLSEAEIKRLEERIASSARDSSHQIELTTAKLDLSLETLKGAITELKSELRDARGELRSEIAAFRSDSLTNLRWLIGLGVTTALFVIGNAIYHH